MVKIQKIRERKGLSQRRLSEISGVPQQTISAIEQGVRKNPGISTLQMLSKALDCTIEELLETDEKAV